MENLAEQLRSAQDRFVHFTQQYLKIELNGSWESLTLSKRRSLVIHAFLCLGAALLSGCGGSSSNQPPPPPAQDFAIAISPSSLTQQAGCNVDIHRIDYGTKWFHRLGICLAVRPACRQHHLSRIGLRRCGRSQSNRDALCALIGHRRHLYHNG